MPGEGFALGLLSPGAAGTVLSTGKAGSLLLGFPAEDGISTAAMPAAGPAGLDAFVVAR